MGRAPENCLLRRDNRFAIRGAPARVIVGDVSLLLFVALQCRDQRLRREKILRSLSIRKSEFRG